MNKNKTAFFLTLALAFAGTAQAATDTPIQYLGTDGMTITTSGTQDGYLTGAMQFSNGLSSFEAYCVEIAQGHAPFSAGPQPYSLGSFTPLQSTLLQGLYSSSYASISSPQDKAAFQTAIWEIMQEPTSNLLNAKAGNFQFYYLSAESSEVDDTAFANHANALLQAAASYSGPAQYELNKLVNGTYQDFIAVSAVPEPESYALLLAGLAAMGFVARRRQAR